MLLVHGLGAHSERWRPFAEYMRAEGIASYAIELKGFGEANGTKGHIDSFRTYFDEIKSIRGIALNENPDRKIYIAGESLGGLIALLMAADSPGAFDGIICASPAFKSRLKFRFFDYVRMAWSLIFSPARSFKLPFDSGMCTRDEDVRSSMEKDHREHRAATSKLLFETAKAQVRASAKALKIDAPVLFLQAGEDKLVDPAATASVFKKLNSPDKKLKEYPGMYHALTIDVGKEKVFADILAWINERL